MNSHNEPVENNVEERMLPSSPQPETAFTSELNPEEEALPLPTSSQVIDQITVPVQTEAIPAPDAVTPENLPEAAVEAEETAVEAVAEPEGQLETEAGLKRGDLVEGTVVKTSPTEVLVDIGGAVEGVVNSRELERLTSSTLQSLQMGSPVLVYVVSAAGQDGRPILSISRALEESDWRDAEEYFHSKAIYEGRVSGYNKGGLIVRFGRLRGFVPASQISPERRVRASGESPEERWGNMVGEMIVVKVVEIKRARNRLILSEQAAVREWRDERKVRLLEDLKVSERRKGRVTSVTDFGAFVDIGGADGLVHMTEISWKHITHPREMLTVGQEVEVEVISVDPKSRRIGLSIRRLEQDPWAQVQNRYIVGQLIQATITKLTKFGAFARLVDHPEIEGLIHISELSEHRVRHPREVVSKGDVLTLRVVKIDHDQRRLGLSLKKVDSPDYLNVDWEIADSDLG
jgi:small subunit ribosomal protein S1